VTAILEDGRSLRLDKANLPEEDETGSGQELRIGPGGGVIELVTLLS
jgi:hypothetical protein